MATFELYRRSTIGMCLTETLDQMVSSGVLTPELAIQVLIQFDKSMTEALESEVKSKVSIKGHLHTYRFCDNVWTFILQNVQLKSEEGQETVDAVKIVACDSTLLTHYIFLDSKETRLILKTEGINWDVANFTFDRLFGKATRLWVGMGGIGLVTWSPTGVESSVEGVAVVTERRSG
ncbi:transcription initiation factor IIA subunit 2 [Striga asiatica]|uniref:Transcription initiation factor IIA subunit 2 n=1 Tax=Striga asiatica TaxID=4170 RepID=A0A5A7PU49_STRAF|nr:transcription initiation factor IIA subunit 2 [Striga asiatica]